MRIFFGTILAYLARAVFSLRYQIDIRGLETLIPDKLNRKEGILFLPNHPAQVDPLFICLWLWPKFRMRPLIISYMYDLPLFNLLFRLVRAISIPNFETAVNEFKVKEGEKAMRQIAEGLKRGENFLVYPSGGLKNTGRELLGGASGVHELLKECPNANVVLIRTTGLWGSIYSRCLSGKSPEVFSTTLHGLKILFKNGLFFAPRRKVLIEIEPNPEKMPRGNVSRIELNRYFENWYNRYPDLQGKTHEVEPVTLVSYSRWRKELPQIYQRKRKQHADGSATSVSEETRRKIYAEICRILEQPDLEIRPEQNLAFELGMDSLNFAELMTYLIRYFDVKEIHPEDLTTVGTVLEIAEGEIDLGPSAREPISFTWPKDEKRALPMLPLGDTLPEALLNSCERMGGSAACGDNLIGALSYKKFKRAVLVLAHYFKTWEEERIAVLLPASIGAYITIAALQMAGKVPVMLNWTLGSRYLEEMMKISESSRIVTSLRFIDRLANVQFGTCLDRLVFLENIRKSLTLSQKLRGAFLATCSPKRVLKAMQLEKIDGDSPCVILFTSGTEAAPKGVPLSHKNIILNLRSAMQCMDFNERDVLYGILPPFHSFGFSVAGFFFLLSGMRIAFYPDPTDSYALAEGIERWKATIFCSAPSFLKGLFHAAKPRQLKTLRYFVVGAEKAPEELFQRVKELKTGARLVEGYGITECSPILSLNRIDMPPKGVGQLLSGVELITIHPETLEKLPTGADGEICVRGPNVFRGYLGNPRTAFIEIDGKQWYRTGDLGYLDPDGNLILSGRLKRFVKIGGELISLGAIEEHLIKRLIQEGRISPTIPSIAVAAVEKGEEKAQIVLFSTVEISREEANHYLQQAGLSNLIKISLVKRIEEIPLMGAGKTNYRALQNLC